MTYFVIIAAIIDYQEALSATERILQLSQFRQLRLPLPFYKELEYRFYDALCVSYRSRTLIHDEQSKISFNLGEQAVPVKDHLKGDLADSANAGFALLGYSGCGKSSALKSLLSRYPQVIYHNFNGTRIPQIVYLVVSCVPNSNFSALYSSIGRAIDSALGFSYLYQAEIEKKRTLGAKLSKIIELVNHFSIGMLILDEIQLIDFSSTKENSFESLLVLTNETKILLL